MGEKLGRCVRMGPQWEGPARQPANKKEKKRGWKWAGQGYFGLFGEGRRAGTRWDEEMRPEQV
jgi:hypothetical protein